jgi:hypothetical protein
MNNTTERLRPPSGIIISAAAWAIAYFLALIVIERMAAPEWLRIVLAIVPAVPFAFFLWSVVREIRALDELHRRVHLEALAIAFPLTLLLLMTLGLLDEATVLSRDDWSYRHIWYFLPLLYSIGLAISWRRYR